MIRVVHGGSVCAGCAWGEGGFISALSGLVAGLLVLAAVAVMVPLYRSAVAGADLSAAEQTASSVVELLQLQAAGSPSGSLGSVSLSVLARQDPKQRFSSVVSSVSPALVDVVPDNQVAPTAALVEVGDSAGGCVVAVVVVQGSSVWVGRGGMSGPGTWWASSRARCPAPAVGVLLPLAYGESPPAV